MLYSPPLCNCIAQSWPDPTLLGSPTSDLDSSSSLCAPIASQLGAHVRARSLALCAYGATQHRKTQLGLDSPPAASFRTTLRRLTLEPKDYVEVL